MNKSANTDIQRLFGNYLFLRDSLESATAKAATSPETHDMLVRSVKRAEESLDTVLHAIADGAPPVEEREKE